MSEQKRDSFLNHRKWLWISFTQTGPGPHWARRMDERGAGEAKIPQKPFRIAFNFFRANHHDEGPLIPLAKWHTERRWTAKKLWSFSHRNKNKIMSSERKQHEFIQAVLMTFVGIIQRGGYGLLEAVRSRSFSPLPLNGNFYVSLGKPFYSTTGESIDVVSFRPRNMFLFLRFTHH